MDITIKRSPLLGFFAGVANLYLITFAASGFVAVADELAAMVAGHSPLSALRSELAALAVLASLLMAFVVAFVPHLPKSVFLPLIGAAVWLALGGPPFGSLTRVGDEAGLFLALCQSALAMAAFLIIHLRTGRPFLTVQALPYLNHVFLRIAFASIVTLIVGLAGLVAVAVASAVQLAEQETKGYLQFTWNDVRTRTAIMRRDAKTVHLVATAHIAERQFYETIFANIPENSVVLAEGITDRKGLLGNDAAKQDQAATSMGLSSQAVFEELLEASVPDPAKPDPLPRKPKVDVVRADVDVSDLSPQSLRCLRADLAAANARGETLTIEKDGGSPACSQADLDVFWKEILVGRNNVVMAAFDKLAGKYDAFVVPWGAMHMPGLETAFLQRGFKIESARMIPLARYETVAGHVFGGLAAFRVLGPGTRPYQMYRRPAPPASYHMRMRWSGGR